MVCSDWFTWIIKIWDDISVGDFWVRIKFGPLRFGMNLEVFLLFALLIYLNFISRWMIDFTTMFFILLYSLISFCFHSFPHVFGNSCKSFKIRCYFWNKTTFLTTFLKSCTTLSTALFRIVSKQKWSLQCHKL